MNLMALVCAILFSTINPVVVEELPTIAEISAVETEETVLVAVIPPPLASIERKTRLLSEAAALVSERTGKPVVLTEDLLTYAVLSRMEKRGVCDYERRNLASRLSEIWNHCFFTEKAA